MSDPKEDESYPMYDDNDNCCLHKLTKAEFLEQIKDFPDNSIIDVVDLRDNSHPVFELNINDYYDYDNGIPILMLELSSN